MRVPVFFCIFGSFLAMGLASGQEPALPKAESPNDQGDVSSASPAPTVPPPQLIPDDVLPPSAPAPAAPSLPQLDEAFKQTPLSSAAEDYRQRIEWRRLRNVVVSDARIKAALARAETARTDLEKRRLLKDYYELFYARMVALASTPPMKAYVTARKNDHLVSLAQPHVRPTPTPSPSASAPASTAAKR